MFVAAVERCELSDTLHVPITNNYIDVFYILRLYRNRGSFDYDECLFDGENPPADSHYELPPIGIIIYRISVIINIIANTVGHNVRMMHLKSHRPLSRRMDRCDRVTQNESRDPFGGNVYHVTMQIAFLTRKFRNRERNLHCDIVHITTKWVSSLTPDCNGVFAIKAY